MKTLEADFRRSIVSAIGRFCDIAMIENMVESGCPDLTICYKGIESWVELKVQGQSGVLLRKFQVPWGMRRAAHGGRVFIFAEQGTTIRVWRYPHVVFEPYGKKYSRITSLPHHTFSHVTQLKTILFSNETCQFT